jgi:energy-coupling factor transporter ATP-binding protein EcfA2
MSGTGYILWLTGPRGTGKTAIARAVEGVLLERGCAVEVLDEREFAPLVWPELGDTADARDDRARRIGVFARLLARNGIGAIVACVSPRRSVRDEARAASESLFLEVRVGGAGDADHEPPLAPEVVVPEGTDPAAAVARILIVLEGLGLVPKVAGAAEYAADEEEEVKKRLKDLGYI